MLGTFNTSGPSFSKQGDRGDLRSGATQASPPPVRTSPAPTRRQTFGDNACHPEPMRFAQGKLREGSGAPDAQILRCAQDDSQDTTHSPLTGSLLSKRLDGNNKLENI